MKHPTVVVFVEFPDPTFPTGGFLKHLAYPDAKLVGFYELDVGESVQPIRDEHEEECRATLQAQAERFEQQGIRTEWSLIFDHDRVEARHQIARDDGADAVLLPGGANTLGKVLVAARRTQNVEKKMSTLLNTVDRDDLISLDLIHIADETVPEGEKEGKRILTEMKSVLEELGVPSVQIEQEVRTGDDVAFELNRASRDYDLLMLGETEQDIGDKIFGPVAEYVVDDRDVPVLITR